MPIILNEFNEVTKIIETKDVGKNPTYLINILTRYYYHAEGIKDKDLYNKIDCFLKANFNNYKPSKWQDYINKQMKNADKYPLSNIEYVPITKEELNVISKIDNIRLERLAFTILCLSKFYNLRSKNNNNWVNCKIKELFKLARVIIKIENQCLMLNDLMNLELITYSAKVDNTNIKADFIDDTSDIILKITDFRELGYEYMLWKGEKFFRCGECGILSKQNQLGNRQYCRKCIQYQPIEIKIIHCQDCQKELTIPAWDMKTKRCDECQKLADYTPIETKTVICIDCGSEFEVNAQNMKKTRCDDCQTEYRKKYDRERKNK